MDKQSDPRPTDARDPYRSPALVRHGSLQELTAQGGAKGTQTGSDQQSVPAST